MLHIDCGQGVRENVSTNPNTTLGTVLAEVCKRRNLEPTQHALRHTLGGKKTILDGSLSMRFAGLSGNATLELVASTSRVAHGECTVALQLSDGARKMAKLDTSSSLASVLAELAPDVAHPVIQYMGRSVATDGVNAMTLLDLGVTKGSSALLRVSCGPATTATASSTAADSATRPAASAVLPEPSSAPAPGHALPPSSANGIAGVACPVHTPMNIDTGAVAIAHENEPDAASVQAESAPQAPPPHGVDLPMDADIADGPLVSMLSEALDMLRSSVEDAGTYVAALTLLQRYLCNILGAPLEERYRAIKKANARFHESLGRHAAARQLLRLVGFVELAAGFGQEATYALPASADLYPLTTLVEHLAARLATVPVPPISSAGPAVPSSSTAPPTAPVTMPSTAVLPLSAATASLGIEGTSPAPNEGGASSAVPSAVPSATPSAVPSTVPSAVPSATPSAVPSTVPSAVPSASQLHSSRGGITLTEAQVATLRRQKLAARSELSVPRELAVLRPGAGAAKPPLLEEVPDDFYELTESDVRGMSLGGGGGGGPAAPLKTRAMRELAKLESLREYTHALVRVRLPGGLLVQAAFHPQEPVEHVLSLALSCVDQRLGSHEAYLFTTPPRTVLPLHLSLAEAGLVPAATAILAWHRPLPEPLAALSGEGLLRPFAAELLAAASSAEGAPLTSAFPAPKAEPTAAKDDASAARASAIGKRLLGGGGGGGTSGGGARGGSAVHGAEVSDSAGLAGDAAGAAKPSKPKWLKM